MNHLYLVPLPVLVDMFLGTLKTAFIGIFRLIVTSKITGLFLLTMSVLLRVFIQEADPYVERPHPCDGECRRQGQLPGNRA